MLLGRRSERINSGALARMNDKSLWRRAYIGERIAGDERQLRIARLMKHLDVAWIDDLDGIHDISECPISRSHENLVISPKVPQWAEECIAMSGDSNISLAAGKSSTVDMSGGHLKGFRGCTFENHH